MHLYVQARCIPVVLSSVPSVSSILLHLAHTFVAYATELPRVQGQGGEHSPAFLISTVHTTLIHVSRLVPNRAMDPYALGITAFYEVLKRHQGRWSEVLQWLERERRK